MPPTNNLNFSITKKISLTEKKNFTFGLNAINFFNHPQYIAGSLYDVNNQGVAPSSASVRQSVLPSNSLFTNFKEVLSSNPRFLMLSLKFNY